MAEEVRTITGKKKRAVSPETMERVLALPTYRWTQDFGKEITAKLASLAAEIAQYEAVLTDPMKLKAVYQGELDALKKAKIGVE